MFCFHRHLTAFRNLQSIPRSCDIVELYSKRLEGLYKQCWESSSLHGAAKHASSHATTPVVQERLSVPVPCHLAVTLNSPANVRLLPGKMEQLSIEVQESSRRDLACGSPVFFVDQHEDSIEFLEIPTSELPTPGDSGGVHMQRSITAWVPERFCSAELSSEGGDVEVAVIKEGELMVYSGQRQFPLTYQMPESGLALNERRWNPDRPGGNVSLRSISATTLDVYTCGGNLKGGSLVAGDVDIDTSGGDVQIGRLMGNDVDVSTQDRGVASAGSGTVSIGAVYADMLHLSSGGSLNIEELNTKDAFVTTLGACGIIVKSLSGTCVLTTAAQQQSAAVSFTLTGQVGHVVASTAGAPISCNLPSGEGQALIVLARPEGAANLQEVMSAAVGSSKEEAGLAGWHRLASFSQQGEAQWELLGSERAATLQKSLTHFARLACCDYLCPKVELASDWSSDGSSEDEQEVPKDGLVLLDAQGGPVSVLQQSWKEMMQQKLNL